MSNQNGIFERPRPPSPPPLPRVPQADRFTSQAEERAAITHWERRAADVPWMTPAQRAAWKAEGQAIERRCALYRLSRSGTFFVDPDLLGRATPPPEPAFQWDKLWAVVLIVVMVGVVVLGIVFLCRVV